MPPILVLPGLSDSGPGHWQTLLEAARPEARRVVQRDWERPKRADWVEALDRAVRACLEPPVLVAHSLGCITVAHWAAAIPAPVRDALLVAPVRGALLVAPSDVDRADAPEALHGFRPTPTARLPFPSIVVSSSNDPYLSVARSRELAAAWGSRWVDAGPAGHVNAAAGLGPWPLGEALVAELAGEGRRAADVSG